MAVSAFLRSAIGVAAQAGKAALAAATARFSCSFDARGDWATASSVAGLITGLDVAPSSSWPLINS